MKFQVRPRRLVVEVEEARKIDGTIYLKHLPGGEAKIGAQAFDDFRVGARFDFQAHGGALAAAMELRVDRIENAARFLFAQVEVAVARDAKRSGGENLVAVVEAFGVGARCRGGRCIRPCLQRMELARFAEARAER